MQGLRGVAANYFYQAEPEKAQPFRTSGGKGELMINAPFLISGNELKVRLIEIPL